MSPALFRWYLTSPLGTDHLTAFLGRIIACHHRYVSVCDQWWPPAFGYELVFCDGLIEGFAYYRTRSVTFPQAPFSYKPVPPHKFYSEILIYECNTGHLFQPFYPYTGLYDHQTILHKGISRSPILNPTINFRGVQPRPQGKPGQRTTKHFRPGVIPTLGHRKESSVDQNARAS